MDRLEALRLAGGADGQVIIEQWVAHAAGGDHEFPVPTGMSQEEAFVRFLAEQIEPNGNYANKLSDVLRGTRFEGLLADNS